MNTYETLFLKNSVETVSLTHPLFCFRTFDINVKAVFNVSQVSLMALTLQPPQLFSLFYLKKIPLSFSLDIT